MAYDKSKFKPAKFDLRAYTECDNTGKTLIANHLLTQDSTFVHVPKENKAADIEVAILDAYNRLTLEWHEVEIKSRWVGDWPDTFKTVDIPYRKHKLFEKHDGVIWFWVISGDLKSVWKVHGKELTDDRVSDKDTTRGNDTFFNIPLNKCELIQLRKDEYDGNTQTSEDPAVE